ncbi:MAG: hypothetical protein IPG89_18205 [Bacteroidetes bacterium]|nr:hypothetical protein [Bacteroidota bacterium]
MKEEKLRRCENPECGKLLPIGNPKRKHCDKSCSNKAGHIARKKSNQWENEMFKQRKNIIKILEKLDRNKITFIANEKIEELGLNLNCSYLPELATGGKQILRFGKFLLTTNKTIGFDISKVN